MTSSLGAVLAMLGLVAVGAAVLYSGTVSATPTTLQAQQVLKDANTLQGVGWILAGVGFGISLFPRDEGRGVSNPRDTAIGPPDKDLPPPLKE